MVEVPLPPAALRIQELLTEQGFGLVVREMPDSTRTAEDAAAACGCSVAQIAKSIVFRAGQTERAILVVTAGDNRVDEKKVQAVTGEKPKRADADFVRASTGFAIGGVAPIGHATPPITLIDEDLMHHDEIWAAAGTPKCVFPLTPAQLVALTGGEVADVRQA